MDGESEVDERAQSEYAEQQAARPEKRPKGEAPKPSPEQIRKRRERRDASFDDEESVRVDPSAFERFQETAEEEAVRPYLEYLYSGKAEKIKGRPANPEQVNEAFMNLEGMLGEVGEKCIENYHKWGDQFWLRDDNRLFKGLIKAYWRQVNIVSSFRKSVMRDNAPPLVMIPPITPEMVTNFERASNNMLLEQIPGENLSEKRLKEYRNLFRIEVGHFKSINRQISRNTGLKCNDDLTECAGKDLNQNAKYRAWSSMVDTVLDEWISKAKFRKDVVQNFKAFLLDPVLDNWNRLIASNVVAKFQLEFVNKHPDILEKFNVAELFMEAAMETVQKGILEEFGKDAVGASVWALDTPFPTGYKGMIDLFLEKENDASMVQIWQAVNYFLSENAGHDRVTVDEMLESLDQEGADHFSDKGQAIPEEESIIPDEFSGREMDPSIRKAKEAAEKRKEKQKDKKSGKAPAAACPRVVKGKFDLGPSENGGDVIIGEEQLVKEVGDIAKKFRELRKKEEVTKEDVRELREIIEDQVFLNGFLETACKVKWRNLEDEEELNDAISAVTKFDPMDTGLGDDEEEQGAGGVLIAGERLFAQQQEEAREEPPVTGFTVGSLIHGAAVSRGSSARKAKIHAEDPKVAKMYERQLRDKGAATFTVLDNGGAPFKLRIKPQRNGLFKVTVSDNYVRSEYPREDKWAGFSMDFPDVEQVWVGSGSYDDPYDRSHKHYAGNTALLIQGNVATSIAAAIMEFKLAKGEKVTRYYSTVGNSAVPYGWIETNDGYYALGTFNCDTGFIRRDHMERALDKYGDVREGGDINLGCWTTRGKRAPWTQKQKIKGLKTVVPRS